MQAFFDNHLQGILDSVEQPKQWKNKSSGHTQRSEAKTHIGLYNYGNICYMISALQQIYMVPQFRYRLLKAADLKEESIKTHRDR